MTKVPKEKLLHVPSAGDMLATKVSKVFVELFKKNREKETLNPIFEDTANTQNYETTPALDTTKKEKIKSFSQFWAFTREISIMDFCLFIDKFLV